MRELPKPKNNAIRLLEVEALTHPDLTEDGRKAAALLIGRWRRWAVGRDVEDWTLALAAASLIPALLSPGGGAVKARVAGAFDRLHAKASRVAPLGPNGSRRQRAAMWTGGGRGAA